MRFPRGQPSPLPSVAGMKVAGASTPRLQKITPFHFFLLEPTLSWPTSLDIPSVCAPFINFFVHQQILPIVVEFILLGSQHLQSLTEFVLSIQIRGPIYCFKFVNSQPGELDSSS